MDSLKLKWHMIKSKFRYKPIRPRKLLSNFSSVGLHLIILSILYVITSSKNFTIKDRDHFEILDAEIIGLVNQTKNDKKQSQETAIVSVKSEDLVKNSIIDKTFETEKQSSIHSKENIREKIEEKTEMIKEVKELKSETTSIQSEERPQETKSEVFKTLSKKESIKPVEKTNLINKDESKKVADIVKQLEQQEEKKRLQELKTSLSKANNALNNIGSTEKSAKNNHAKANNLLGGGETSIATLGSTIRSKLISCWKIPPLIGIETNKVYVILRISLNESGTVSSIKIVNGQQYVDNKFFNVIAESSIKAVQACSPVTNLPREQYSDWREIELIFDPSKFLGR